MNLEDTIEYNGLKMSMEAFNMLEPLRRENQEIRRALDVQSFCHQESRDELLEQKRENQRLKEQIAAYKKLLEKIASAMPGFSEMVDIAREGLKESE